MATRFRMVLLICVVLASTLLLFGLQSPATSRSSNNVSDGGSNLVEIGASSLSMKLQVQNRNQTRILLQTNQNAIALKSKSSKSSNTDTSVLQSDVDSIDKMYFQNRESVERRIEQRMKNIEEALKRICKSVGSPARLTSIVALFNSPLYQINELNLTWCPVFKSGSTTWKTYFIDRVIPNHATYTLNELSKRRLVPRYDQKGKTKLTVRLRDSTKCYANEKEGNVRFTVVRHPLSRLISHVKNAAKDNEMVAMQREWIAKAITYNRGDALKGNPNRSKYETEFKRYFSWLKSKRKGKFQISKGNVFLEPPYPQIDDLINFIVRTNAQNGHWTPAWTWCRLCANKFHYIIKLEEEPLELWYLLEKLGLWPDRALFLKKSNRSKNPQDLTEEQVYEENLKRLNNGQRGWVNAYFQNDFKIFEYEQLKFLEDDSSLENGKFL